MILVGSQRGGSSQLASHLMNDRDNDHVTVHEVRGFVAGDLRGALDEAHAIAKGTRCKQYLFSLSFNPPKNADISIEGLHDAIGRAEETLGLTNQPRAIVIHEKNGRRHAHVVWSRIDADEMKAVNLPHFKTRLCTLSKDLYLEHGFELPDGHKTNGWKNPLNFSLAEWQQAKRLDLDPREIKQLFRDAWTQSDNLPSLAYALEEHGYFLAKGDRRGVVALDIQGEVYSLARWAGVKTKELQQRLGNTEHLPSVEDVRKGIRERMSQQLRDHIREDRQNQLNEQRPLIDQRKRWSPRNASNASNWRASKMRVGALKPSSAPKGFRKDCLEFGNYSPAKRAPFAKRMNETPISATRAIAINVSACIAHKQKSAWLCKCALIP
jgi:hypothetical protein